METQPAPRPKGSSDKAVGIGVVIGALVFAVIRPFVAPDDPGFYIIGPGGFIGGVIGWFVWRLKD